MNQTIELRAGSGVAVFIMFTHALALTGIALGGVDGSVATLLAIGVFCSAAMAMRTELGTAASIRRCGFSEERGWWLEARDGCRTTAILEEFLCLGYHLITMVWRDHKGRRYRIWLTPETVSAARRRRLAVYLRWGLITENTDQFGKNFPPDAGSMSVACRRTHRVGGVDAGKDN